MQINRGITEFLVKVYSQIQNGIDAVGYEVPSRVEHKIMGVQEDLSSLTWH